jgi:3-oxoacyl-[acyl-carrier protein] reductase
MLTQSLSIELAEYGITVNEMIPGPVKTKIPEGEIFEPFLHADGDWENEWVKRPEDIVPMAVFLASQHQYGPSGQSFALNRRLL